MAKRRTHHAIKCIFELKILYVFKNVSIVKIVWGFIKVADVLTRKYYHIYKNVLSNTIVNILGDEAITKQIVDRILAGNTFDNFGTETYEPSNVICMKPIDVPSNGLLEYNPPDGGDSFHYKLAFTLSVYNINHEMLKVEDSRRASKKSDPRTQ
jgi:hypothetical protein